MNKIFGSWSFYKKTLTIAIPIMIQNLITNIVALVDNIMVGQVGTEQMSGVAIVNQILFVYNLTIFGAISGAGIFCAQFFGKGDFKGVRDTFRYKLIAAVLIVAIGTAIFSLSGDNLITLFLHDAEKGIDLQQTFEFAKQYMAIMLIGLIPFSIEQTYSSTLREGEMPNIPMFAGICAVITNTFLNYLLIFGAGPFPKLGVQGAAIATVISRFVQAAIVIIWTHANTKKTPFSSKLYSSFAIPKELAAKITTKGLIPLVCNEFLWSAGTTALVQCYSMRGIDVVAGLNISNTVVNLFNVLFIAFGSGVSIVIGQMLGAGKLDEAKQAAPKLIMFSALMCIVVGAVMACLCRFFPLAYNTSDHVRSLASSFIFISAVLMPIHSALHSTYFVLRSGGKTVMTFFFDSGFSWLVVVPLAFCLANFTSIPIIPLYFFCQLSEAVKCIIGAILIKKGVWLSTIIEGSAQNATS